MSCGCFSFLLAKKKDDSHSHEALGGLSSTKNIRLFSYNELRSATTNFHPKDRIGRGGFGTVYKGTLRNGTSVAVKVLSAGSKQGVNEFLTEIDVITNVKHPNLVELIGCCVEERHRILVYEYMENNSLDKALLGHNSEAAKLTWSIRSGICVGTARGLTFLHEELDPPIVHRDIKASNILLDRNYAPKIGDFGLAKLFPDNVTHISTRVAGTTGYLAPEYALHGQLTKKADVYSFGVLIIEIVSGRSISKAHWSEMEKLLLEWTWQLYKEGRLIEVVDPNLEEYPEEEIIRYIKVALFCIQAAAKRRPSMPQIIEMLSKPMRLNEKELTPPGLIKEPGETFKPKGNSSGKDLSSLNSTAEFTSANDTHTEIIPR